MKTLIAGGEPDFRHLPATPARLLFDNSVGYDPRALENGTDRHLLFVDPAFDIHMKIAVCGSRKGIHGQVIHRVAGDSDIQVMLFTQKEQLQATTTTDDCGVFGFDQVPTGHVCIEILTRSHHVATSFDA
jgi:hypothetical protein